MNDSSHCSDREAYPTREESSSRWRELARAIAAEAHCRTDSPDKKTETPGRLVVIGSGIEVAGFTMDSAALIETADEVFYCVADPATQVWIRKIRPDAYDLYTLYDDRRPRYQTYMQMTAA